MTSAPTPLSSRSADIATPPRPPMVYSGPYPIDAINTPICARARPLQLNDAALTYEPETSRRSASLPVRVLLLVRCTWEILCASGSRREFRPDRHLDGLPTSCTGGQEDGSEVTVTNRPDRGRKISESIEPIGPTPMVLAAERVHRQRYGALPGPPASLLGRSTCPINRLERNTRWPLGEIIFDVSTR